MTNFCTLFDSFYLNRALVMYESLKKNCPDFHLYIFPFDDLSHQILKQLNLERVTLISLAEFESKDLLSVKQTRSKGEYCWTCTPFTIRYCLDRFNLSECTYIDADLCFYSDPACLINELKDKSVLITDHRYSPEYDVSSTHGIYCVQFLTIKNTTLGSTVLNWWRDRCLEWCYNRLEDGKFGDQKYLDDWTTRFEGVHVLENIGGGVAPWNVQQYDLSKDSEGTRWITEKTTAQKTKLIFYHFHYVKFLNHGLVDISDYQINHSKMFSLYAEYLRHIELANDTLSKYNLKIPNQAFRTKRVWLTPLDQIKRKLKGVYNVFEQKAFINKWLD